MGNITPRVDIAFKKIFGVEENKDLLISLINSMVSVEDQVSEVILLNPYNPKNFQFDKLSILDVKAKTLDGKRFNIEIQITDDADYDKRALYYWAKLYTEQLREGNDYSLLSKAIGIHILNFTSIPDVDKYHNVFHITEKDTGIRYFKELELHTVELKKFSPNYNEELSELMAKINTSLDIWLAFLTRHDLLNKDNLPKELNDINLKKALSVLDVMNFNAEEREAYEGHLKWLRIEASTLKKCREDGRVEGRIEGRIEGIELGTKKGREEEAKKIAINMLNNAIPIENISNLTGLSIEIIKSLAKK